MNLEEDNDRIKIREELSTISFEDIKKLKEKLGTKVYNDAIFVTDTKGTIKKLQSNKDFKRVNKNRPRETTSKIQVPRYKEIISVKKKIIRDPRYDDLCGTYNDKAFKNSYKFLRNVMDNDIKILKEELKDEEDPKRIDKIKYLVQRLENRKRENDRNDIKVKKYIDEKNDKLEALKRGEKPVYKKKSDKRVMELIEQYEELKKTGKLKKHIERLRKKKASKDRKKFSSNDNDEIANNE